MRHSAHDRSGADDSLFVLHCNVGKLKILGWRYKLLPLYNWWNEFSGSTMRTIHYSDACNSLEAVIDQMVENQEAVLITRWGAPNAVVMSEEQYTSWAETIYLLNSPANAEHLARSLE